MKFCSLNRSLLFLLLLAAASLVGCASDNVDNHNISERPWNSPTSWEQAGPMSGVLDQH